MARLDDNWSSRGRRPQLGHFETSAASLIANRSAAVDPDVNFMSRALELARLGLGRTAPNPMVGCVIVKSGQIVGEGWHKGAGRPHAEPEALAEAGARARGARAYVTLEPCNHHGRTPPCTEALLKAGVSEVVYAVADTHALAAGGATRLQSAGVKVRAGVLETEARELNRAWFHSLAIRRPYVIAKAAMSLDGRIATATGQSKWITGALAREKGHELRRMADAIIVGAGTIVADDPALTARLDGEESHPLRVVLDSKGRCSPGAKAFDRAGKGAALATTAAAPERRLARFREHGVEPILCAPDGGGRPRLDDLLDILHRRGVVTAMIEGGGEVLGAALDADLIDEVWLFIAPLLIGGGKAAFAGAGASSLSEAPHFDFSEPEMLGPDMLVRGLRRRSF
ncbi:MAG: bifunctional diaminohydroxyphosphoribosylaminopyrimidine deaminase/5-amino-6-(5-phosphoribosylamino)uracil reductase RibD [Parvularculaceae bacterium]|nr:bifunctional diaminohydroxyphosphoribosylaminopyrimidine deaminase/5-amino-6-(5-phosphoribosylamino)uracil reductase RibD [Parvularculaceae bacterium]